ncbi:MAG: hypothetical protein O2810_05585 [Bacteroidetes bacterium]|nr:hypothetical protein [Bacteroidota bacterium]MDA1084985.1 hypothetical protein [Bacteroidota bacterium]
MKFLSLILLAYCSSCSYNLVQTPLNIEVSLCFGTCLSYNLEVLPNSTYVLSDFHKTRLTKGKLNSKQRKSLKSILTRIALENEKKIFGDLSIRDVSKIKISFNSTAVEINGRSLVPQSYKPLLKWADEFYTTNTSRVPHRTRIKNQK